MAKFYKLVVFVPIDHADNIRSILGEAGAGHVGNYDFATFSVRGTGRFRPRPGARPAIGEIGKLAEVAEERIETVVSGEILDDVLFKLRKAHPYEEPAIDVYRLENENEA